MLVGAISGRELTRAMCVLAQVGQIFQLFFYTPIVRTNPYLPGACCPFVSSSWAL